MTENENKNITIADAWSSLRQYTAARVALGRTGNSVPTQRDLEFRMAHAHARDAVYAILDKENIKKGLESLSVPIIEVRSKAVDRKQYLQRPDLGRQLDEASQLLVTNHGPAEEVCIIFADGLSAGAINNYAVPLVAKLAPMLQSTGITVSPFCLAEQARVAIGDEVAFAMKAALSLVLIGERPGLSAAESMGAYITYHPHPGLRDDSRNCVSNIHEGGLNVAIAAEKIFYLISEALRRKISGVSLKDNSGMIDDTLS